MYWKTENNTKDTLERRCQNVNITFLLEVISEPRFLAPTLPTPTREHPHYISSNSRHISTFLHLSIIYPNYRHISTFNINQLFLPQTRHIYIFTLSNYLCLNSRQIFTLLHLSQFHISRFFIHQLFLPRSRYMSTFLQLFLSQFHTEVYISHWYFLSNFFCPNYLLLLVFLQQEVKCAVTNPRLTESFLITFNMFRRQGNESLTQQ